MRVILSIMHTVFSRYDAYGNPYDEVEVNEKMQQKEPVDEEDYEDYEDDLMSTWEDLWQAGKFPKIVTDYLDKWHDRFYLYDEKYPFFQVTKDNMSIDKYITIIEKECCVCKSIINYVRKEKMIKYLMKIL